MICEKMDLKALGLFENEIPAMTELYALDREAVAALFGELHRAAMRAFDSGDYEYFIALSDKAKDLLGGVQDEDL